MQSSFFTPKYRLWVAICGLSAALACVPAKKYQALTQEHQRARNEQENFSAELKRLEVQITRLERDVMDLEKQNEGYRIENDDLRKKVVAQKDKSLAESTNPTHNQPNNLPQNNQVPGIYQNRGNNPTNSTDPPQNNQINSYNTTPNTLPVYQSLNQPNPQQNQTPSYTYSTPTNNTQPIYTYPNTQPTSNNNQIVVNNTPNQNTNTLTSPNQLNTMQVEMEKTMAKFQDEDGAYCMLQEGQLYVLLNDELLFKDNKLSNTGTEILNQLVIRVQNNPKISIALIEEGEDTALKTKLLMDFFSSYQIAVAPHRKNLSPQAFETSGTKAKKAKSTLIVSQLD
jgi:regulator of replication initiation timing